MAAISSGGIFVKVIGFGFKILCFNKFTRQDSLSAISIADANGHEVKGKLKVNNHGDIVYFFPDSEWKVGDYALQIESRLEDLAGNNLDRLFDVDLNKKQDPPKDIHKRQFEIR